jgi:hypothetical protein
MLTEGDTLCVSFPREHENEGYFFARVLSVGVNGRMVTYGCNQETGGVLPDFLDSDGVGALRYEDAVRFNDYFWNDTTIPHPHTGGFSKIVVTHATRGALQIVGTYVLSSIVTLYSKKPIYRKVKVTDRVVTHMWPSNQDKYVFGNFDQMNERGGKFGYAVAEVSSPWPHYIRDFLVNGLPASIFSYATKAQPGAAIEVLQSSAEESSDEAAEESDTERAGAPPSGTRTESAAGVASSNASDAGDSAGAAARRSGRALKPTVRSAIDPETAHSMLNKAEKDKRMKENKRRQENEAKRKEKRKREREDREGGAAGAGGGARLR